METMAALYGSKQTSSGGRPRRLLKSRHGRIDKLQAEARKAAQRLIPSQLFFWVFFSFVLSLGLFVSTRDGGVFRAERLASAIKKVQRQFHYITMHFPQQPALSPGSLTSILPSGAREPNAPDPEGFDISLLYRRISRTRS